MNPHPFSWVHTHLYDPQTQEYRLRAWDETEASADVTNRLMLCILRERWFYPGCVGMVLDGGFVAPLTEN